MMGDVVSLDARRAIVVNGRVTYAYATGGGGNVLHLLLGSSVACGAIRHRRLRHLGTSTPGMALEDAFVCDHCKAALRRELA